MADSSTSAELATSLRTLLGELSPGDRLPSSRELVQRYRVSPVTVARAIAQLAAEGSVITRPGSGTYAAQRVRPGRAAADTGWQTVALTDRTVDLQSIADMPGVPPPGTIMMDGGYLHPNLQPVKALSSALARAARRPGAWDRAPSEGLAPLRSVFANLAGGGGGTGGAAGGVSPEDVLITSGGQSALSMTFRAIAAPGSPILVECPTYPGAIAAARAAGLRPVPVPIDEHGTRPDLLADAFAMTGARLFYCQPAFSNPAGTVLAAARRAEVIDVARASGAFVVEDDFGRYLSHGSIPPRPLLTDDQDGTVVYVTSLTKPAAPSMRIGALIARGPVMERLRAIRQVDDFFVARPLQEAALELLSSPAWERHIHGLGMALRDRAAALVAGLERHLPGWEVTRYPAGGLHLWLRLPAGTRCLQVTVAARAAGVAVSPGFRYFAAEVPGPYLRIGFAATASQAELGEAVQRLATVAA
ncbi:PLP-dependent aminotransferase family protein [Longispora albida]|uniref:aminotransferase-like domain-containing protein n=1 Tax=Longispora albida TaxID=203523 RepID=UPI00036C8087|nr:PLP-dependent aminotransferase family protein [Longispora albida]